MSDFHMIDFPVIVILKDGTQITDKENPVFKKAFSRNHRFVTEAQSALNQNLKSDEKGAIHIIKLSDEDYNVLAVYPDGRTYNPY